MATSYLELWNSARCACFARVSIAGLGPHRLFLPRTSLRPIGRTVEHDELIKDEEGTPIELGRGAMGVTYKAIDVDLHCLVALKIISEQYLGDEAVRLRFLREARAAASVRHPNVASVFHLEELERLFLRDGVCGRRDTESLIRRSRRLEEKLALEIAMQVVAGLAAVHKQKLVHRDIKPSNIMVEIGGGRRCDGENYRPRFSQIAQRTGSANLDFNTWGICRTPEFASPEQFAGVLIDIRSDLYSLGVTLWKMVAGQMPYQGTWVELMHQHQHRPLPLEQLKGVPQPVAVLLEALLKKDPGRRFQSPTEVLKAMRAI